MGILALVTLHGMIGGLFQSVGSLSPQGYLQTHQGLYFLNVVDVFAFLHCIVYFKHKHMDVEQRGDLGRIEGAQHDLR